MFVHWTLLKRLVFPDKRETRVYIRVKYVDAKYFSSIPINVEWFGLDLESYWVQRLTNITTTLKSVQHDRIVNWACVIRSFYSNDWTTSTERDLCTKANTSLSDQCFGSPEWIVKAECSSFKHVTRVFLGIYCHSRWSTFTLYRHLSLCK